MAGLGAMRAGWLCLWQCPTSSMFNHTLLINTFDNVIKDKKVLSLRLLATDSSSLRMGCLCVLLFLAR